MNDEAFEAWFKEKFPLHRALGDFGLKNMLRTAWRAGVKSIEVHCVRSSDGRVFANVNSGGKQLAHLKANESWSQAKCLNRSTKKPPV